ncbi:MAG: FtsX-like permease family protein [Gemmatimonadales bacterium]|nr:FtsX-like permease family protein [Gemmatimonadales bacterium]NIQ99268.1 FtsX-like permease family protein [Gemmatimonadales bacterium]
MKAYTRIISTLRSLFRKEELDRDLDEELRSYLDLLAEEKIRAGMNPEQARREARLELGGVEQVKEKVRERRLGATIDTLFQDARYAVRTLMKNAGFTVIAVLILAIGIGANTALFSNIHTALVRGIPFPEPDRLVAGLKTIEGRIAGAVSRVDYYDYRESNVSFEELAALADFSMQHTLTGGPRAELVQAVYVTWNLFTTLGVNAIAGRNFLSEDEAQGGSGATLISYGFWQRRFGGAPDAVGSTITLDGLPLTVVGVMPRGFRFLLHADLWRLVDRDGPFDRTRDSHSHYLVGRLKPGVTVEQAQSEADAIAGSLEEQYPETNASKGFWLTDLHGFMVDDVRLSLLLLMATTVLVLLIACGNVAGLLLARGERRLSEMAMRSALGASKRRLVRQLLTESVILTVAAGALGVIVAYLLQGVLLRLLPVGDLGIDRPVINAWALGFTVLLSIATGLLVGVIPALRGAALQPAQQLRTATHASEGIRGSRLRSGLVVSQVALSIALLIGSGLLIRSLAQLSRVDLGFNPDNLLTGQLRIQAAEYPSRDERNQFFTSLLEELEALPGVESATLINKLPILSPWQDWGIWPADQRPASPLDTYSAMARWVAPGYFETMGIPLVKGRDISATDVPGSPAVVVLSEATARALFDGSDPIGRAVGIGWHDSAFEVVGVVGDVRLNRLRDAPGGAMYMSSAQMGATRLQIAVRTTPDPATLVRPIENLLQQKDPNVLFARPASMTSIVDDGLADFRIVILSLTLFAGLALALAAIGLYGVLAYHVSQRTNEIGIRLAMGASNSDLIGMILKRGLILIGVGLLVGTAGAYPGTLLIRQLLYETRPLDPAAYVGAVGFLGLVAALACFLPAWRATQVDVVEVLRPE